MKKLIENIINWNKIAGNTTYDKELEYRLFNEEAHETLTAIRRGDIVEILDWVIDTMFVWIWTLGKLWFTPEQIEEAIKRITDNNYSKFQYDIEWHHKCLKDEQWKILKPMNYTKVDLTDLLPK